MQPAQREWVLPQTAEPVPSSRLLDAILAARSYLDGSTTATPDVPHFHDPFLLPDMTRAVDTIKEAIKRNAYIAVYGDYDSDGVTACALLVRSLRRTHSNVIPYIPHRQTEGYGLNRQALIDLNTQGVTLVITVDCGTSSVDVAANRPAGMDLIITDHHLPPTLPDGSAAPLPDVTALVNPKVQDAPYPWDGLSGSGVAWKLVQALEQDGVLPSGTAQREVGLAAIGTITDIMTLHGENRAIVNAGISELSSGGNIGIFALMEQARLSIPIRAQDVAFSIGPRINAAGRMDTAHAALELCLTDDPHIAKERAAELDQINLTRRSTLATSLAEAELMVAGLENDLPIIVVGSPEWHMGIVGLIAGRLVEQFARPTFAISLDPTEAKGSGRSVPNIPILPILKGAEAQLLKYGGHAGAAGFSLNAGDFEAARSAMIARARSLDLPSQPKRQIVVDAVVDGSSVQPDIAHLLDILEPFGYGNPVPIFALLDCEVIGMRTFGAKRNHIRVTLRNADAIIEAIAFNRPALVDHLPNGRRLDICASMEWNVWRGNEQLQLHLKDIQPAGRMQHVTSTSIATPA